MTKRAFVPAERSVVLLAFAFVVWSGPAANAGVIRQLKVNRAAILTEGRAEAIESNPPGKPLTISGAMRWAVTPPLLFVSTAE
ncbi:MAG: hypothetical protein P8R42_28030 [Candidatus Binatia bacterium]|nr:hypothetical protein [Candidatus Binatia bacterium]